jgi:NDP-sugar pyrophosphorylase family protein
MSKRAIILAGGKGTRLRPYTVVLPKPLMPIGDYPILEVIIRQLVHYGFDHITLAVNHQANLLKAFFGDGSAWGIKIDYSLENSPMGTIGPLKFINDLPDNFLVMNGDVLTDLNFDEFFMQHVKDASIYTISSKTRQQNIDYGVLQVDADFNLNGFEEKPKIDYQVSMGIYMVNLNALKRVPEGPFGFDNLMISLLENNEIVKVKSHEGYWLDIGRVDDYIEAIDIFEAQKALFLHE